MNLRTLSLLAALTAICACDNTIHAGDPDGGSPPADSDGGTPSARCQNGIKDGDETDVDCGGSCGVCPEKKGCSAGSDCASGSCRAGACDPSCSEANGGCDSHASCANTPTARTCTCPTGYAGGGLTCTPSALQPDAPWPMLGHDPQHTGRSAAVGASTPHLKYQRTIPDFGDPGTPCYQPDKNKLIGAPVISAAGGVFFTYHRSHLPYRNGCNFWVDEWDLIGWNAQGGMTWRTAHELNSSLTTPAIGWDGALYASHSAGIDAINPNGTQQWSLANASRKASPVMGGDRTLYTVYNTSLTAVDAVTGLQKWTFAMAGCTDPSSPALAADSTVYVGCASNGLFAVNPDGTKKWSLPILFLDTASPTVGADGTIYLGSHDKKLHAINPDGTEKWAFVTAGWVGPPSIAADGTIVLASDDFKLYAVHPDGTQKWAFDTKGNGSSFQPTLDADGTAYIGIDIPNAGDVIYAVKADGTQKWAYTGDANQLTLTIGSSPAIAGDGTILVSNGDSLLAIGP